MNKIDLSIITPIHNNIYDTKNLLNQIRCYTQSNYHLIIIDNGSDDGTVNLLNTLYEDSDITVIKNPKNMGYGYANNQAIDIVDSKYVCFLNNDVLLYPGWDKDLIKPFNIYGEVGATGPVTNNCAGVQCDDYGLKDVTKERYRFIAEQRSNEKSHKYRRHHRLIGFCLLAEAELIKEIRGFDEGFNIGNYEDDDLCVRILLSKKKIIICENAFIYHFGSQTFKKNNIDHLKSLKINAKLFADKWSVRLGDGGGYTYDINKLNNNNIKNRNYLTNTKSVPDMIRKPPKCAALGHLKKLNQLITKRSHHEVTTEYKNILKIRPFHPEATLQLIDYYLENNVLDKASQYTSELVNMTPAWPLVKKLVASFDHSLLVNNKHNNRENEKISFCLITKDEQVNIERCLKSLNEIKNKQIIVVDTGSTDNTIKIAKSFGAEIHHHEWNNDFSDARNRSLEYARGDWVMFLDADEELSSDAVQTLKEDMSKLNILGYRLPLKNVGSPLTHGCNYVPRLVRNAPGLYFIGKIHETIHLLRFWL